MFHERKNDGSRGIRTDGNPGPAGIPLSDGGVLRGSIQPAPACYATPVAAADGSPAVVEFWPEVVTPPPAMPHAYVYPVHAYTDNPGPRTVTQTTTWADLTVEAVAEAVREAIDGRWEGAVELGIPVAIDVNGETQHALLRYLEVDRLVWSTHSYGMPAPAGGLLVALQELIVAPGKPYDGREQFSISGQPRLDAAKLAIRDHVNRASHAWETGRDDVAAIENGTATPVPSGGWTDENKVAALAAYDVEALDWPPNEVPSS